MANFTPLLFMAFHREYQIRIASLALIPAVFYVVQLITDFLCAKFKNIDYRKSIIVSEVTSALGLAASFFPALLHAAETEKYAHVTFFLNGGREEPFVGEDRILVTSPQVATYDLKPEMSAFELKDRLVEALKTNQYDWVVVTFANADMVGHTGVYTAIESAVEVIDECLKEVVQTATKMGYETIITADHGNAEHALNADCTPNTAHTTNPVPFIYVTGNKDAKVQDGSLADVAPSILHILGLEQPREMTGRCLIVL